MDSGPSNMVGLTMKYGEYTMKHGGINHQWPGIHHNWINLSIIFGGDLNAKTPCISILLAVAGPLLLAPSAGLNFSRF
jgi:hypothetical protein